MKYLMQIKVECFGVAYGVKVKNIIEMQCLKKLKVENNYQNQECLVITKEVVFKQSRKIPNWKAPGRDGVQSFWIKKLTNLHEQTVFQLNKILNGNQKLSDRLTYGRMVLCQKDTTKGNAVENY